MSGKGRRFVVKAPAPLLEWLLANVPGMNRTQAKTILRNGAVAINGSAATRHDVPLNAGDEVVLGGTLAANAPAAALPFPILFEDDYLIAIDKPSGLLSVAAEQDRERTAHRILGDRAKARREGEGRVYVVHRLDRETSGVLLFAKNEMVKRALQEGWASTVKEYDAVLDGVPENETGTLVHWLWEDLDSGLAVKITRPRSRGSQEAITHYRVVAVGNDRALVRVQIETGRKHQIRVQFAEIGAPVAGDERYGLGRAAPRLALHAAQLTFQHPVTGAEHTIISKIPDVLARLVR